MPQTKESKPNSTQSKTKNTTKTKKICFVCLGNICRSPLAEGIANYLYATTFKHTNKNATALEFSSAGTSGFHNGEGIDARSIAIAKQHNIDISSYKSKQVSPYAHSEVDMFIAMDRQNYANLLKLGFAPERIALLGDFGLGGEEVPDPYYGGSDGFSKVYEMLKIGITNLLEQLQKD